MNICTMKVYSLQHVVVVVAVAIVATAVAVVATAVAAVAAASWTPWLKFICVGRWRNDGDQ